MSSENAPVTAAPVANDSIIAPDPAPQPPAAEAASADPAPIQSTSEANIAATDPNVDTTVPSAPLEAKPPMAETDIDMKAADLAEGAVSGATVVAPDSSEDVGAATSSSKKNNNQKRRSSGVVPEHKSKKLGRKKSMPVLRLDVEPGQYYFARLKGHPSWPAIVCDEDMLPESLLASRPVTAARPDGSYREDFMEGGKNAKDRTYPVMFLYTNEFAWLPNVDLSELDVETINDEPQGKKGKKLYEAYKVAAEGHDLDHFKKMLSEFEMERQKLEEEYERELAEQEAKQAEKAAEKAAKKEAKKEAKPKRKSKGGDDVEMTDAGATPKSASKKRKKSTAVEEADESKPAKTPKTLKVSLSKGANGESSAKAKPKSKPKATTPQEPVMTEEEKLEKKQKSVLYLRHRLQKGFLQDSAPAESEMSTMAAHFETLEQYQTIEAHVLKNTKIHKVLKAIIKLDNVPMDDQYKFKERSHKLLQGWNRILADGVEPTTSTAKDTDTTNGVASDDKPNGDAAEDSKAEKAAVNEAPATSADSKPEPVTDEPAAASVEATLPVIDAQVETENEETKEDVPLAENKTKEPADVTMTDAPAPVESGSADAVTAPPAEAVAGTTESV